MMLGLSPMDAIIVFDVVQVLPPLLLGPSQIGVTTHATHACNAVLVQLIAFQNVRIATSSATRLCGTHSHSPQLFVNTVSPIRCG